MFSSVRAALIFLALVLPAGQAATARITLVLTNDIYEMAEQVLPDGKARGGFARLAAVVKGERAKGNPVIVAHGGDTLSPSLMSGLDRGAHIITLTNMIRPDIFAPGNHEFDFGKDIFLQRMAEANFPRFAANLRGADGRPLPGFKDSEIVTLEGVRIGLIGATFDDSARASNPGDLQFSATVPTMRERAAALKRDGADFVIAVMHATRGDSLLLAATSTIDATLTGHTHDLFIQYNGRNLIAESNHDAHYVLAIDIDIEIKTADGKRQAVWWPNFRVIDTATVTPDPDVLAVVRGFEQRLSREMSLSIGTTAIELDSRNATVRGREASIGDLIADAMCALVKADVAIMNGGGIRAGRIYPPGTSITRGDVLAELPFGNRVVRVTVTGAELKAALENGFSLLPRTGGRFPQVSGMTVEIDPARPAGDRVLSVRVGDAPLDPAKTYSVAINDFMSRGGDGYTQFVNAFRIIPDDDAPLLSTAVMDYVRTLGTIRDLGPARIVMR